MPDKRLKKRFEREHRKNKGVNTEAERLAKNEQIRRERESLRSLDSMLIGQFAGGFERKWSA